MSSRDDTARNDITSKTFLAAAPDGTLLEVRRFAHSRGCEPFDRTMVDPGRWRFPNPEHTEWTKVRGKWALKSRTRGVPKAWPAPTGAPVTPLRPPTRPETSRRWSS